MTAVSDMLTTLGAGLLGLAIVAVALRARSAAASLDRQLDAIRAEIGAERAELNAQRAESGRAVTQFREDLADLRTRLQQSGAQATQFEDRLRELSSQMSALSESVGRLSADIADTTQFLLRRPLQALSIPPRLLETAQEEELIALAESIAVLRPLVPYPGWRTDLDRNNPDMAYQLRRWFWQYFNDRRREAPAVLPWHDDTRLRLFLGNDTTAQIYITGCLEPNEFAFLDRILQPGMTFLDAGANDGIYTVFAANRVGSGGLVWAFEPSRRELDRLQYNLDLNNLAVPVFAMALADCDGRAELAVGGYEHEGHNTLGAFAYEGIELARQEMVEVRRLDDIVNQNPPARIDVMKLDVEGAELRLLRGAVSTLRQYRPIVLFEVSEPSLRHQGSSREELLAFLVSQDYRIHAFDRATGLAVPAAPGMFSDNMIGVPREKTLPESATWAWPSPKKPNGAWLRAASLPQNTASGSTDQMC